MARPALRRGENSPYTFEVREPGGKWTAASSLPDGYKAPRGSTWRARCTFRATDRSRRLVIEGRTKAIAHQNLDKHIEKLRQADGRPDVDMTLGDFIARYREDLTAGKLPHASAQRTIDSYEGIIRRWCLPPGNTQVAGVRLSELTVGDLNREQQRIVDEGGWSQIPHIRAIWRAALRIAIDDNHLDANPAMSLSSRPPRPKSPERVYKNGSIRRRNDSLTEEQLDRLLKVAYTDKSAVENGWADLIALSAMLGQRIGEIISQRWQDVHLDAENPYLEVTGKLVRKTIDHTTGKTGIRWEDKTKSKLSSRKIPLTVGAYALLRRRLNKVRALDSPSLAQETYVFPGRHGTVPNADNVTKRVRRLLDKAELPWATNHTLRRTVEMRLLTAGVSPLDAQKVMGHTAKVAWDSYMDRTSLPVGALRGLDGVELPDSPEPPS